MIICTNVISIHALLAESDLTLIQKIAHLCLISIHALLAESDRYSLRRSASNWHFYPRSPCGERPEVSERVPLAEYFYPRSPCGERPFVNMRNTLSPVFLSTLSLRRATYDHVASCQAKRISIHALLAESDHFPGSHLVRNSQFLSTLSLRRATGRINDISRLMKISIHALLAESDGCLVHQLLIVGISIHALLAESDIIPVCMGVTAPISIHALLAESDGRRPGGPFRLMLFLSTLSLRRATQSTG